MQTQTTPGTPVGVTVLALIRGGPTGITRVSPTIRANTIMLDEVIRRYAKVLTALLRPRSRSRKGAADERAAAYEAAKADLRSRVVRDLSGAPVLFHGSFEWEPGERNPDHGKIRAFPMVAGEQVTAVPAISVGMQWLKLNIDDEWVSNGEFYYFLFRPVPVADDELEPHHIAFPVGLCSRKILTNITGLYAGETRVEDRLVIDPIDSDFDRTGTRKFVFTPTSCNPKRNFNPEKPQFVVGHYAGKIVMTEVGSAKPEPIYQMKTRKGKNGEDEEYEAIVGYQPGVYRYTEGSTIILVKWLGDVGSVTSKDEVRFLDLAYEADPFEGLGMEALMFEDEAAVDAQAAKIRSMPLNEDNPLLAMLVNTLGLTTWDAEIDEHMDLMEQAMIYCVEKAKQTIHTLRTELKELFTFSELETIGKALKGVDLVPLKEAKDGTDLVTEAIAKKLEVPFDWSKKLYPAYRLWLIGAAIEATVTRTTASPNAPASPHPQPALSAPNTDEARPALTFKKKVRGAWVECDSYALLGISSDKAANVMHELRAVPRDLTTVALVINPLLMAKNKPGFDLAKESDAEKLQAIVNETVQEVLTACEKVVTGAPNAS